MLWPERAKNQFKLGIKNFMKSTVFSNVAILAIWKKITLAAMPLTKNFHPL